MSILEIILIILLGIGAFLFILGCIMGWYDFGDRNTYLGVLYAGVVIGGIGLSASFYHLYDLNKQASNHLDKAMEYAYTVYIDGIAVNPNNIDISFYKVTIDDENKAIYGTSVNKRSLRR